MNILRVNKRPAPFVLVATGHGSLIVNRNDYRMIDDKRGYGVGFQIFNSGYFDPDEVDAVLTLLNLRKQHFGSGLMAVDCGANIGVHTIEWAKHLHGWGKVLAIEAQERIFYALAGNIALNNCFNAQALHAAVGAEEGRLDIPSLDYNTPSSFGSFELKQRPTTEFIGQAVNCAAENLQTIRLLSIDSLQLPRVDFIKIDVEGMELEVLAGANNTITQHKPQMLIEMIKVDKQALTDELTRLGYCVFPMGINLLAIHESDPSRQAVRPA